MLRRLLPFSVVLLASFPAAAQVPASQPSSQPAPSWSGSGQAFASAEQASHEAEEALARDQGVIQEDVATKAELFRRGSFTLQAGGMIQVQSAFYVGDQADGKNHDPMDTEGFRVRRARLGFGGYLIRHFRYYLAIDLKDTVAAAQGGDQGTEILDATITWDRFPFMRISAGVDKVPFSAFALRSSSKLELIERPLPSQILSPDRRVGATLAGSIWWLDYAAGLYNGSAGVTSGNKLAGMAYAVHLQLNALGRPTSFVPRDPRIALGGGFMYNDGAAINAHKASAHVELSGWRTRLVGEFLWESTKPDDEPVGDPDAGEVTRMGAAGQVSVFLWREYVQVAARYEYFLDNEDLAQMGDQQLITGGLNVYLFRHNLKLQVNYTHRGELTGAEWDNDIAFAQLQAMF